MDVVVNVTAFLIRWVLPFVFAAAVAIFLFPYLGWWSVIPGALVSGFGGEAADMVAEKLP